MASFNDSRCVAGGVCPSDPLLFTCELYGTPLVRVVLPNGYHEVVAYGDTADRISLPAGFTAKLLHIMREMDGYRNNISVTLFILNASLLDGGKIICDSTTLNVVKAGCPLLDKSIDEIIV